MKLHWRKLGDGHPLIILHGVFGSSDNWQTLGKEWSENYTVYLVDQRNHGKSPNGDEHTYESMASDLKELIEDEKLEKPYILGHSMGGKTAMKFSCQYPDDLAKLIVVDIAPKNYPPHHQQILAGLNAVKLDQIQSRKEAEEQMAVHIQNFMIRQFLLKNLNRTDAGFSWKINLSVIERSIDKIGEGLGENEKYEGATLFIGGNKSDYITQEDYSKIHQHFPSATIEMIADAGHWVHADNPSELSRLVKTFLG